MKKIKHLGYFLTLVLCLMLPKAVLAASCVATTYDQYVDILNPGFSCTVGDLEFSNFGGQFGSFGFYPPSNIQVSPQSSAGQAGFAFTGLFLTSSCMGGPEGCMGDNKQLDIYFTVTALNGLITGNSSSMTNYNASGSISSVGMNGLSCSNCNSPPSLTGTQTFSGINSTSGGANMFAFAQDGGNGFMSNGYASINDVTTLFTLSPAAVPIPAAVWLFGSGLLGLIGVARRKAA